MRLRSVLERSGVTANAFAAAGEAATAVASEGSSRRERGLQLELRTGRESRWGHNDAKMVSQEARTEKGEDLMMPTRRTKRVQEDG